MLLTLIPVIGCILSYRDCLWIYESPCLARAGRPSHANTLSKFWSSALRGRASSGIANNYCDATYASHKIPSLKETNHKGQRVLLPRNCRLLYMGNTGF